jgi:type I restriction enzyme, S subunit
MNEWNTTSVENVVSLLRRGTAPVYVERSSVLAIGQRCIRSSGFDHGASRPHLESVPAAVEPQAGDVLLNSTGTGTIGRSCVFPAGLGKFMVDGHVTVVRPRPELADGRIINEFLKSDQGQRLLETRCFTGSTNQVELSRTQLGKLEISFPPLEEQRRIAEILDTIDETIQATERVIAKLEDQRNGVIAGELARSAESSLWTTVDEAFEVANGITLNPSRAPGGDSAKYLRVANVRRGALDLRDVARMGATESERVEKAVQAGDLLVIEGHADPNEIGRCALVSTEAAGLLFQNHLFRLRPKTMVSEFAELWLNSKSSRAYWRQMCSTSSGLHTINRSMLRALPVPCTRLDVQHRVAEVSAALGLQVSMELELLQKLRRQRVGLAADLLSGRVRTVAS